MTESTSKRRLFVEIVLKIRLLKIPESFLIKTGKAKAIRFSTLESICKALNCQPGDILEYVPEENA
ncbi:MAG: helix-turn-helix domain-containing protein [Dyadobacter sp.]|nr:helix-turn-helix domain-containing protein [Dyadobacter sp.]MBO9611816.1 helix-turn-helix domain-containing protein [Dyadobacter sp.]